MDTQRLKRNNQIKTIMRTKNYYEVILKIKDLRHYQALNEENQKKILVTSSRLEKVKTKLDNISTKLENIKNQKQVNELIKEISLL